MRVGGRDRSGRWREHEWVPQPQRDMGTLQGKILKLLDFEGSEPHARGYGISIRKLREGLGLTPHAAAALLEVTEAVLLNYESKPPDQDRQFTQHALEAYIVWAACAHVSRDELAELGRVAS